MFIFVCNIEVQKKSLFMSETFMSQRKKFSPSFSSDIGDTWILFMKWYTWRLHVFKVFKSVISSLWHKYCRAMVTLSILGHL